jgi:putative nucleotidyltransferase with HDIG domain
MTETPHPGDPPLYSSRIIGTYINFIKKKYPYIDVESLLIDAGMQMCEVEDQGHWFTQNQVDSFFYRLVQLTDNLQIAREAGRFSATSDAIGAMQQYILGLAAPSKAYEMIGHATKKFTRSTRYECKKLAPNQVEITVHPIGKFTEKRYQCENRVGFLEAMTLIFTNRLPVIHHPECLFEGGKVCRYHVSWESSFLDIWKRIRYYSIIGFALLTALLPLKISAISFETLSLMFIFAFLLITLIGKGIEAKEIKRSLHQVQDSTKKLLDQIDINYNQNALTHEISQILGISTSMDDLLLKIIKILEHRLDYDRGMIMLADSEKKRLEFKVGFGYGENHLSLLKETSFRLNNPNSRGVFVLSFHKQKPLLINDISDIESDLSLKSRLFSKKIGTQSFICCPIVSKGESIGVLTVDNVRSKRPLVRSDINLLSGIASTIGTSIMNARLHEANERQFHSMIHVLAASIDARDPLTSGHSHKVTEYALEICDELGLSVAEKEVIRVAALLHDYGKIGVPDSILKKQGILTEDEFSVVKNHAEKTRELLSQIHFKGIFKQVPKIAGAHHEKVDGSGYPDGLKKDEIPLGARIIAVADFFEAITAKRHYRDPMPLEPAYEMLIERREKEFDGTIVDALLRRLAKNRITPHSKSVG